MLVSTAEYNDRGEAFKTIDPAEREDRTIFDDAGRRIELIENYVDGDPDTGGADEDRTTRWTYTPDGQFATITAVNPDTGDQVTRYVYGTTVADSDVARSDLLRAEIYPDSDDTADPLGNGADDIYDRIEHKYNRQGERKETKDQNETVHAFDFDKLGRPTQDRVTALGTGVDGAVRRIETTYEVRSLVETLSSYDDASVAQGSIVNQVLSEYNDFAQVTTEYQSHSGAVNTSTTPKVQYGYADGSDNTIRPTSLTYPDGRVLTYDYGTTDGINDAASRVEAIKDGTLALVQYAYLGQASFVEADDTEPQIRFTLVDLAGNDDPDTGDIYSGLDRFGRVKDNRWHDYGASADADRIKYGYDRIGLVKHRDVTLDPNDAYDELYAYENLYRLGAFDRGALNSTKDAITTLKFGQQWVLDPSGNWAGFRQDDDGDNTWDLEQERTANPVSEISDISETMGPSWLTPAYDRAGNMTTIPQPADPTASFAATFDAWNRLVKLTDGSDTVQENEYDGLGRRSLRKDYAGGSLDETRHVYYSDSWQALEERVNTSSDPDRQFVWGLRYVDELVYRDQDTTGDGSLDERLYALHDANWNVTAILNTGGDIQERYAYDAYAWPIFLTPVFATRAQSEFKWDVLFSGRLYDAVTGLYQYRMRYYHARLGFFVSRDPIEAFTLNLYEYTASAPTVFVDPTGEQFVPGIGQLGGTLGGDISGRCCWILGFMPAVTVCVGVQARGHVFTCCDGQGRRRAGAFGEGCLTFGAFLTGTVKKGCTGSLRPRPQAGIVLTTCPGSGCVLRGCVVCSVGIKIGWFKLVFGCRWCTRAGGAVGMVCGWNIGGGTGCSGQICYTCTKVF